MIDRQSSKLRKLKRNKIVFNAGNELKMKTYIKVKQFSTILTSHDVNTLEQKKQKCCFSKYFLEITLFCFLIKAIIFIFSSKCKHTLIAYACLPAATAIT